MGFGCDHEWVPSDPMIEWMCIHCQRRRDGMPRNGPDLWVRGARWVVGLFRR